MLGKTLDSAVMVRGLKELNPDFNFDVATKMGAWHPRQATRQGVFLNERHICSMDRGIVPEFKQWSVITSLLEVGWEEADKEDVTIQYSVIKPSQPEFLDCALHVMNKDTGYEYRPDGSIMRYTPVAYRKKRGRIVLVGWRHTFGRIIAAGIPGCTPHSIGEKFGVDMWQFPMGSPQENYAALIEE
jgi:hypothetical protein